MLEILSFLLFAAPSVLTELVATWTENLQRFSHFLRDVDKQVGLGVCKLAADGHQAAVRGEQQIIRLDITQRRTHALDNACQRWHRSIARVDAAEHNESALADAQHRGIVVAAGKFHGEAADARLHQLRK